MLNVHSLLQHVSTPTHCQGHTLDVVITRTEQAVESISVDAPSLSDHSLIVAKLAVRLPHPHTGERKIRRCWRELDVDCFRRDLLLSDVTYVLWPSRQRRRSVLMLRQCFVSTRRQARSTAVSRHPSTTTVTVVRWWMSWDETYYTAARASLQENSCQLWLQGVEDTTQQPAVILSDEV